MSAEHTATYPAEANEHQSDGLDRLAPFALYLALGLVALLLRVLDLGGFVIEDEARYWIGRSFEFLEALERGDYGATAISTHPGVTTMWSGSIGTVIKRQLLEWGLLESAPFPTMLALMRLPAVLVHVAGILVGYALLRRMLPLPIATLAALLWATDPFIIAFSRMLHVDGLMTTFTIVSVLAACSYWHHKPQPGMLILSGACGALAVMSKSPGLIVVPVVGIIWLWAAAERLWADKNGLWKHALAALVPLCAWGLVYVITLALVWPAIWADPVRVYDLMRIGVEVEGGSPHVQGNYFLGQPNDEPGILFYPVAVALRLTPWAMLGILALPLVWHWGHTRIATATRRDIIVMVGLVLLFIIALSLFPKKLNRYIVPAFPALNILAAVGLVWATERVIGSARRMGQKAVLTAIAVIAIINAAWWHPYSIAYFNQTLGGAQMGAFAFLIGAGEGLEQAADWLNAQPDITGVVVASTMTPALQPYLREGAQAFSRRGDQLHKKSGYVVVYVRNVWDGATPPFDQFYQHTPPLHTVTIHGVDYAWIYDLPEPMQHEIDASFSGKANIHLHSYEVATTAINTTGTLTLTVQWQADAPIAEDYMLFIHVLDAQGQRIGQVDVPLAGADAPTSSWEPGRYYLWRHPVHLPADIPPGDYWLATGLYNPQDMTRLPVQSPLDISRPDLPDTGGNTLLLPVTLP